MNSRERVLLACNHREADRLPIDCGSMRSTGISAITYNKLKTTLGLKQPCLLYDFQQQLAYVGDELRERFHVDSMDIGEAFIGDLDKEWKPWVLPDGTDCLIPNYMDARREENGITYLYDSSGIRVGQQPPSSFYVDQVFFPYGDLDSIPDELDEQVYSHTMWDVPALPFNLDLANSEEDYREFVSVIKAFRKKTDRALMISIGHSFLEFGGYIRRPENFLCDILLDRSGTDRLLGVLEERYLVKLDRILSEVADDIDIVQFGDDLGTQNGPWMAPEMIRDIFVPHYKKLWDYVHNHSKCKVFMHNCGAISLLLGYLIDAGLDIINPVQTTAANMDPVMLKREFGKDLTFWGGGCEAQGVLTTGTPEEIRDQVRKRIEIFGKDGGFVFNQIHNVLANVPVENVLALYDAAYEYGKY
ncbi:uroporphyrinogen decarboxylase [Clostridia bacterium]|nr:uroporphyrinogen decarboxylase [Clostridia bacterium]